MESALIVQSHETFIEYCPSKLSIGQKHPDLLVESASLASVTPPDVWYQVSLPDETVEKGLLSAIQLESIIYSCQRHEQILPDGSRAGYLIGDGTGVGKGRTLSGLIYENFLKGRKKSIWISVSSDLKYDAERDLSDIGGGEILVFDLKQLKYDEIATQDNGSIKEGVMFSTYSSLIGQSKSGEKSVTRLEQLVHWCGKDFDGVIVFDESHRAKNVVPIGSAKPSKVGKAVIELQNRLPNARITYASATGATEPLNMAYMVRLGLWGKGTTYKEFTDFLGAVDRRGVGAMEIVAMEMKHRGMFIARQLSFKHASFQIDEISLSPEFIKLYDDNVKLWVQLFYSFTEAAELVKADGKMRRNMWARFWSAHQRFFNHLCVAAKVDYVIEVTKEALQCEKCVVIGLQSTGEAESFKHPNSEDNISAFFSTAKGVLQNLVDKHFPTPVRLIVPDLEKCIVLPDQRDSVSESFGEGASGGNLASSEAIQQPMKRQRLSDGEPEEGSLDNRDHVLSLSLDELLAVQKKLEMQILIEDQNELPCNSIDELIEKLGGPQCVAELTGRRSRLFKNDDCSIQQKSRTEKDVTLKMINIEEKDRFMAGTKNVAIISEAASVGTSLQADRRVKNQRQRVHITLELPWSAERALQQFGRTHRSNQVCAPEYVFLISGVAGERRFASAVAKRLESLGALAHGDRHATETCDLSHFNINTIYGRDALRSILKTILFTYQGKILLTPAPALPPSDYIGNFFEDVAEALMDVGLIHGCKNQCKLDDDYANVAKFLNRLLGMPVRIQNSLFKYFCDTMTAIVTEAKKSGHFDSGIIDLGCGQDVSYYKLMTFKLRNENETSNVQLHTFEAVHGPEENEKQIYHVLSGAVTSLWTKLEPVMGTDSQVLRVRCGEKKIGGTAIPNSRVTALIKLLSEESENIAEELY